MIATMSGVTRELKAQLIANSLWDLYNVSRFSIEDFDDMNDLGWTLAARVAQVPPPSTRTRERVIDLLYRRQQDAERGSH